MSLQKLTTLPGYSERTRLQLPYYQLFEDQIYSFYRKLHIHQVQSFQEDKDKVNQVLEKSDHHIPNSSTLPWLAESDPPPVKE